MDDNVEQYEAALHLLRRERYVTYSILHVRICVMLHAAYYIYHIFRIDVRMCVLFHTAYYMYFHIASTHVCVILNTAYYMYRSPLSSPRAVCVYR